MGLLKLRKNKKFNYKPRHYDDKGDGSPYQIEHKFDKFRSTVGVNKGIKSKALAAWTEFRESPDRKANKRILIIVAIFVIIFLFIIDFDLTIFRPKE